jgi:hypothetical protein
MRGLVHVKLRVMWEERLAKRKKAALFGCGLLENLAETISSALSSDMARPVVVTDVTAAAGAGFGPVENHGARTYSGKPDAVKS